MYQFANTVSASTTRGSAIRPLPEGSVLVHITRFEDDEGRNTQSFVVHLTKEQALVFGQDILRAAADLPLVNGAVVTEGK